MIKNNALNDVYDVNAFSYSSVLPFLKDINVKDALGNNLLVLCQSMEETTALIMQGASFDGFSYKYMKDISRLTYGVSPSSEKLEKMFELGVLGVSKQDIEDMIGEISLFTPKLKAVAIHLLGEDEYVLQKAYHLCIAGCSI